MNDAHKRLLGLMSDGVFHSGQQLAEHLNVTRASVWKYLQQLRDYGLEVESRHGLGYRLPQAIELLDASKIKNALTKTAKGYCSGIDTFEEIDSTNAFILNQLNFAMPPGSVVMAEYQTNGKGRRGHQWLSPYASGINFSLFWRQENTQTTIGALSLIIGVAVIRSLKHIGIHRAGLKWPNDILIDNAKLGGILIDLQGEANGPVNIVIGVGLNYRLPEAGLILKEHIATDICTHTDTLFSRNELAALIISSIFTVLDEINNQEYADLINEWRRYDAYKGRTASLLINNDTLTGILNGVNDDGCLLMHIKGEEQHFACGELSLRVEQ